MLIENTESNGFEIAVVTGSEKVITDVQSALDLIMAVKYESGTDRIEMCIRDSMSALYQGYTRMAADKPGAAGK